MLFFFSTSISSRGNCLSSTRWLSARVELPPGLCLQSKAVGCPGKEEKTPHPPCDWLLRHRAYSLAHYQHVAPVAANVLALHQSRMTLNLI